MTSAVKLAKKLIATIKKKRNQKQIYFVYLLNNLGTTQTLPSATPNLRLCISAALSFNDRTDAILTVWLIIYRFVINFQERESVTRVVTFACSCNINGDLVSDGTFSML
jgi:hypothetical protein